MSETTKAEQSVFARDVDEGLSSDPKFLSSKYFYDDEGSRLFQRIMGLPEYYLTRAEMEIFTNSAGDLLEGFGADDEPFDLIELGAGDGKKTAVLVSYLLGSNADFRFVPIDISSEAIDSITSNFRASFPGLDIHPETGDYFRILGSLSGTGRRKLVLFLGSNIGNFSEEQALRFFREVRSTMAESDRMLIGFDLHKDPGTILNAYDDSQGVTRLFNLNLLKRINRELDADFDILGFDHYASYHPLERAARSFLISRRDQTVTIGAIRKEFRFAQWEPIFMEISQKYDLRMIESLASGSGFAVAGNFFDSNGFYADSLWKPV